MSWTLTKKLDTFASLIILMVSVDVKYRVYLLTTLVPVPNKPPRL